MSSKKARRKKRREEKSLRGKGKSNPALRFILGIAVALFVMIGAAFLFA